MISRGGCTVSETVVEDVLRRHPAVEDVAVVAVTDPVFGQRVGALIALRSGATGDGILAWAAERLSPFEVPERVSFCSAILSPHGLSDRRDPIHRWFMVGLIARPPRPSSTDRYKGWVADLRSGERRRIEGVVGELRRRDAYQGRSQGEQRMLVRAEKILAGLD